MTAVFVPAGAELLSIAVLMNISKWVYFTLYIKTLGEAESPGRIERLQKQRNLLDYATIAFSLIILTVSSIYFHRGCGPTYSSDEYDQFSAQALKPTTRFLGILYFLLAAMFFVVAFFFVHFVERYHADFYQ